MSAPIYVCWVDNMGTKYVPQKFLDWESAFEWVKTKLETEEGSCDISLTEHAFPGGR